MPIEPIDLLWGLVKLRWAGLASVGVALVLRQRGNRRAFHRLSALGMALCSTAALAAACFLITLHRSPGFLVHAGDQLEPASLQYLINAWTSPWQKAGVAAFAFGTSALTVVAWDLRWRYLWPSACFATLAAVGALVWLGRDQVRYEQLGSLGDERGANLVLGGRVPDYLPADAKAIEVDYDAGSNMACGTFSSASGWRGGTDGWGNVPSTPALCGRLRDWSRVTGSGALAKQTHDSWGTIVLLKQGQRYAYARTPLKVD